MSVYNEGTVIWLAPLKGYCFYPSSYVRVFFSHRCVTVNFFGTFQEKRIEVKMQRWKSEDSELEVEPIDSPVEGAQGSAPGTSGKINTELTLALKHLDNLTKKAEHLKSDWTSQVKVVDKKSTTHHKTAKCPPPSSTEAMARESSSSVPNPTDGDGVLNLDQPHLDALSKEEETSESKL